VPLSGTQVFTATISNTTNTALNWYVNGVLNGNSAQGTLTACTTAAPLTCTYTAPTTAVPSPNPAVVEAASVADPAKYAIAKVTVADSIAVTLSPSSAVLVLGGTEVFTATIGGTTNTALNWYVNDVLNGNSAQGTLTACATAAPLTCTYTAPTTAVPSPNPAVIKVASVADPAKYATANVTVTP
jgi:Na+/melibiose symporter-like transporter